MPIQAEPLQQHIAIADHHQRILLRQRRQNPVSGFRHGDLGTHLEEVVKHRLRFLARHRFRHAAFHQPPLQQHTTTEGDVID